MDKAGHSRRARQRNSASDAEGVPDRAIPNQARWISRLGALVESRVRQGSSALAHCCCVHVARGGLGWAFCRILLQVMAVFQHAEGGHFDMEVA